MSRWQRRLGAVGVCVLVMACGGCGSSSAPVAGGLDRAAIPQCTARGATAAVVGPLPAAMPGAAAHDYPWLASDLDLAGHGYVEEEYFFCGQAPLGGYTTRMIVRRPRRAADANGAVLAEWLNVTFGYDFDALWQRSHQHIMRAGYTWVGISAQRVGLYATPAGLKAWSPRRYAQLDQPQGSALDNAFVFDPAAYAIYGQALKLLKHPGAVDPLGGIPARWLIATGGSQSAGALSLYYDLYQPLDQAADGYLPFLLSLSSLLAALNSATQLNADIPTLTTVVGRPLFLVNTETDPSFLRQPDSALFRLWEVAGASHMDQDNFETLRPLLLRDLGTDLAAGDSACADTPRSRIPFRYALNAAMDHLLAWMRDGTPPPAGQPFQYDASGELRRDGYGNVLGGIRLPQHAVASALNSRDNPGCELQGRYQPFDTATLRALYADHAAYVSQVKDATAQALQSGYINSDDAQETAVAAQAAAVPE